MQLNEPNKGKESFMLKNIMYDALGFMKESKMLLALTTGVALICLLYNSDASAFAQSIEAVARKGESDLRMVAKWAGRIVMILLCIGGYFGRLDKRIIVTFFIITAIITQPDAVLNRLGL